MRSGNMSSIPHARAATTAPSFQSRNSHSPRALISVSSSRVVTNPSRALSCVSISETLPLPVVARHGDLVCVVVPGERHDKQIAVQVLRRVEIRHIKEKDTYRNK